MFFKIFKRKSRQYLFFTLIPFPLFNIKHNFYKNSFFPLKSRTTYILTFAIQKILAFSKIIFLNLLGRNQRAFNSCNFKGIKLIKRLRLELSQVQFHFQIHFVAVVRVLNKPLSFSSQLSYIS